MEDTKSSLGSSVEKYSSSVILLSVRAMSEGVVAMGA